MQPTTTTNIAEVGPTTPSPTKPVLVTVIGLVIGVLSMTQAYFGSGHIPSAAEVSGLLGGAGVTLGSVLAFLSHHFGINKAMLMRDAAIVASSRPTSPALALAPAPVAPAPIPPNPTPGSAP